MHAPAAESGNRPNMRKKRFAKQISGIRMFAELRQLHGSGAIRGYYNVWAYLHAPAAESGNHPNMRKKRFAKQISGIRMFAELRKLHGSGAIRGYYNVWACLHAPAAESAESECLQDPIDIFSHRVYTVYSLKMITRVRVDARHSFLLL